MYVYDELYVCVSVCLCVPRKWWVCVLSEQKLIQGYTAKNTNKKYEKEGGEEKRKKGKK